MSRPVLQFLDVGFFVFHTVLVLFNLLGWAWKKTRKWNVVTLALTAISWFVLGAWYGVGYCICTDYHFQIRRQLGYHDTSPTYIHFLVKTLTGADLNPGWVETITAVGFVFALTMSVWLNVRDWRKTRGASTA